MKVKGWIAALTVICIGGVGAWGLGTALRKANEGHGLRCEFGEHPGEFCLKTPATCTNKAVYYYSCPSCSAVDTSRTFEYGEVAHTFDNELPLEAYKVLDANCQHSAYYVKFCDCGAKSTNQADVFAVGELGDCSFQNGVCIYCGEHE